MKYEGIVERVMRRLLREEGSGGRGDDLAVCVVGTPGVRATATVYRAEETLERWRDVSGLDGSCIVGWVNLWKPTGAPCRGAWMIAGIAGPGRLVYGLAYALSPTGLVVPDRTSVSTSARAAWKGYASKAAGRGAVHPLDDADHPPEGQSAYHDAHHTEDPNDDCYTSHSEDFLNAAYEGHGDEDAMLKRLQAAHQAVLARIPEGLRHKFEEEVQDAGYFWADPQIDN